MSVVGGRRGGRWSVVGGHGGRAGRRSPAVPRARACTRVAGYYMYLGTAVAHAVDHIQC
eukprot:COSAG05_NODE_221_length_13654_cov_29.450103_10_plen_59_part_00